MNAWTCSVGEARESGSFFVAATVARNTSTCGGQVLGKARGTIVPHMYNRKIQRTVQPIRRYSGHPGIFGARPNRYADVRDRLELSRRSPQSEGRLTLCLTSRVRKSARGGGETLPRSLGTFPTAEASYT